MTRSDRALGAGLVLMMASLGGLVMGALAEGCGATPSARPTLIASRLIFL